MRSAPDSSGSYVPPPGSIPTLPVPDLANVRRVHMIGIGGAGMRNLARLLLARGIAVTGSDLKAFNGLSEIREAGAHVAVGHEPEQLGRPDAVVISSAIPEHNVEVREARRRGLPVWVRAQVLTAMARGKRLIAVAGTHGKTTTTSMLAVILERSGLDSTYVVGGDLSEVGSGARAGAGDLFIAEADESDGSFLLMDPEIGVVTNVDVDHLDFYRDGREEIESAFSAFQAKCGRLVSCADDPGARRALEVVPGRSVTYGTDPRSDVRLTVSSLGPDGARGSLRAESEKAELRLSVDGSHNLLNAAAACSVARMIGIPMGAAAEAVSAFGGVQRRFEYRGTVSGVDFYDDYGHLPTEVAVTLDVARRTEPRRLVAVFQPHRYSRTLALWRELGASLLGADLIVVTDVYGAEQEPIPGVTGQLVVDGVQTADRDKHVVYLPSPAQAIEFLAEQAREGDLVITLGCGDVWTIGDAALERIRETR